MTVHLCKGAAESPAGNDGPASVGATGAPSRPIPVTRQASSRPPPVPRQALSLDRASWAGVQFRIVKISELMQEYDLEIDDVRWYLSKMEAERLLEYRDKRVELCRLIWSGRLEADLYNMEERYLAELQDKLDARQADESEIRKIMAEIESAGLLRSSD